jgi:hypothetical protein
MALFRATNVRTLMLGFFMGMIFTQFVNVYLKGQELLQESTFKNVLEELTFQPPARVQVQQKIEASKQGELTIEKKQDANNAPLKKQEPVLEQKIPMTATSAEQSINKTKMVVEFERQERVVIVTKIHGPNMSFILEQMLCLLTKAYNGRMQYDVLIFTSESFSEEEINVIQAVGAPAKVTIVKDNPGLPTMVNELEPARKAKFLKRCNITTPEQIEELNFYTKCAEERGGPQKLAYTWQCEFRSLHIWKRPELAPYRYMLWLDADGFCTNVWKRDPVAYMIQNQLAIFFGNWPQGGGSGKQFQDRFRTAFNQSFCGPGLKDGHFVESLNCGPKSRLFNIHGFFHITDLDFYRSDPVMHWAKTMIGDGFMSREFDDQLAVTVPAAILAPERSWDMYSHGFKLNIFHNAEIDGKGRRKAGGFRPYWKKNGKNFTEAWGVCKITAGN